MGELTTPRARRSPQGAISSGTRSGASTIETIPPLPETSPIAWLRTAAILAASSSERAPATQAAATSPCEWPTTAAGSTPWARQSAASETIVAKTAGCRTLTRSKGSSASTPSPRIRRSIEKST